LFDGIHQTIRPEWLVEHRLKALLTRFHDRVRRVPAKAGHQDNGYVGLYFAQTLERLVAVKVWKPDIDQGGGVRRLPHEGDRLVSVTGRFHARPLTAEQVMRRPADGLVGVDDQDAVARQSRRRDGAALLRLGYDRGSSLVNQAANFSRPVEQVSQARDDVFIVAGISIQDGGRIGDDVVKWQR
jgi:hypothetical protein